MCGSYDVSNSAEFQIEVLLVCVANDWKSAEFSLKQVYGKRKNNINMLSFASKILADDTVKHFA